MRMDGWEQVNESGWTGVGEREWVDKRGWTGAGEQEQVNESWGTRADEQERLKGVGEQEWTNDSGQTRVGKCERRWGAMAAAAAGPLPPFFNLIQFFHLVRMSGSHFY